MMRTGTYIAFTLGFLLIGALLLKMDRERTRAQAFQQHRSDSLQTALDSLRATIKQRTAQDTALAKVKVVVRLRVDTLVLRATVAESVFVSSIPDSLKAPFLAVIALKDSVIAGLKLVIQTQEQQLSLRSLTIHDLELGLAASLQDAAGWKRMASPGLLTRIIRAAPSLTVAAGIGFLFGSH